MSPLSIPRLNQRTRCALLPWVNDSGTTVPCAWRCRVSSPICVAAFSADSMSVRLELQADCLAGAWAQASDKRDLLDPGDIEEALQAAQAIGDDRLQKESTGSVTPETWTHGSSAERARWFKRGFEVGTVAGCDTFGASKL